MNKTSADATRLTAPPALHWARDRRALHPRRHGPTRTFEEFFDELILQILLKRKIGKKSKWGHGGVDSERDCREPNEVQGAPSAALRLHLSCS